MPRQLKPVSTCRSISTETKRWVVLPLAQEPVKLVCLVPSHSRNSSTLMLDEDWPEALAAVTGSPEMDAGAILDYFAPLQAWLDQQNGGRQCGW